MDLNRVSLIGNLVRDPESRSLPSGQQVTRFTVATNYAWQDTTKAKKEAVDFHDIIAPGKLGEIVRQYMKKGSKLYIEGRLRKRAYADKDKVRRTVTEVVADNIIMLGARSTPTQRQQNSSVNSRLVREDVDIQEIDA
jgi:single-strand DNA-binding protein